MIKIKMKPLQKKTWIVSCLLSGIFLLSLQTSAPAQMFHADAIHDDRTATGEIAQSNESEIPGNASPEELIRLLDTALDSGHTDVMKKVIEKHGEEFLSTDPLLAARVMLALQDIDGMLRWSQKAQDIPQLNLEDKIFLAEVVLKMRSLAPNRPEPATEKLQNLFLTELRDPNFPESRKEELVYILLDLKAHAAALPYIKELANTGGGNWVFAYVETARSLGLENDIIDFWRARAKRSDVSEEQKRDIAFQLLEANQKPAAIEVFMALAAASAPDSQEVDDLLFLWGPRPMQEALNWMVERAQSSQREERADWMKHLLNGGAAQEALKVVGENIPDHEKVFQVYLETLGTLQDAPGVEAAIRHRLPDEQNPDRLIRFGELAEGVDRLEIAIEAYQKSLAARPDDASIIRRLGSLHFYQESWQEARGYLGRYLESQDGDWRVNYQYAEVNQQLENNSEAQKYYQRALQKIAGLPDRDFPLRMAAAYCLYRLGRKQEAITAYENLLAERPQDKEIRTSYVSTLMELGEYQRAHQVLNAE